MTRERALELARSIWGSASPFQNAEGVIADAILAAVAEENESCAKVAESADGISGDDKWDCCAEFIRDAIRARGIPLKVGA